MRLIMVFAGAAGGAVAGLILGGSFQVVTLAVAGAVGGWFGGARIKADMERRASSK